MHYWFAMSLDKQQLLYINWLICQRHWETLYAHIIVLCVFSLTDVEHKLPLLNHTNIWLRHQTPNLTCDALVAPSCQILEIFWENLFFGSTELFVCLYSCILQIPCVTTAHRGQYRCKVFNLYHEAWTDAATITIGETPAYFKFIDKPASNSCSELRCNSVQWQSVFPVLSRTHFHRWCLLGRNMPSSRYCFLILYNIIYIWESNNKIVLSFNIYFIDDQVTICEQEIQHSTNLTPLAKHFCGEFETQGHITGSVGQSG